MQLIAISAAAVNSATPMTLDAACKLKTLYIQLMKGLVSTKALMPTAS